MFSYKLPCGDFQTVTTMTEKNISFVPPVYEQRYCAAIQILMGWQDQIKKVVEFGCAEIRFFPLLRRIETIENIVLVDIDEALLRKNMNRIDPLLSDHIKKRQSLLQVQVLQGNVADSSDELRDTDAVIALELIEHVYEDVLTKIPLNVFGFMQPKIAIFSTPNSDYNVIFTRFNPLLPNGFRHEDHKFEWTREEFKSWCTSIVQKYPNYMFALMGVGDPPKGYESVGHVSQIAIFVRKDILELELENPLIRNVGTSSPYQLIHGVTYPFHVDTRSQEQRIWDDVQYELNNFKQYCKYQTEDDDCSDIHKLPFETLLSRIQRTGATREILDDILKKKSVQVKDDFVLIEDSDDDSVTSTHSDADEQSLNEVQLSGEDEELWGVN
ncbi:small RNA 2'-O-methyltransferase [Drosophila pseudoobscura]|uniref:Small RNA 2'-O-methyltransferase n=1 Tax=Drosophila pseudoobscura pseudoobscura TaxID=46245 RepID=A0A6I8VS63_DROPS|nr:small RNA 2'-O-methyltransferase [Drosophila pseudoobscura]